MLPKKNRADRKAVEKIFKDGVFFNFPNLTFKFITNTGKTTPQISFIAPKSIARLAVKRNFLRRLGYKVLDNYINQFPFGLIGVFVFKKYQEDSLVIEREIKMALSKIK